MNITSTPSPSFSLHHLRQLRRELPYFFDPFSSDSFSIFQRFNLSILPIGFRTEFFFSNKEFTFVTTQCQYRHHSFWLLRKGHSNALEKWRKASNHKSRERIVLLLGEPACYDVELVASHDDCLLAAGTRLRQSEFIRRTLTNENNPRSRG